MQKKLLAAAVSGAIGAMAAPVAMAQNATVNVYGAIYAEYASIAHANKSPTEQYQRYDQLQNPGSAIGFRGEEKLGGGLSAWFQCETTMDWRGSANTATGSTAQAFCNRDSAVGLKGAFGNAFMGNWGTPFKRVTNDMVGANDTGVFGDGRLLYGNSSTYLVQGPNGAGPGRAAPGVWRRRQSNLIAYDSPNFAGFQVMGAVTTGNMNTGATTGVAKARLWGLGGAYNNGPIAAGVAYEKHQNFYGTALAGTGGCAVPTTPPTVAGCAGTNESAWVATGSYTFPVGGGLKVGAQYSRQKADTSTTSQQKVNTWMVGVDWNIAGPHIVRANYARAGDVTGSGTIGAVNGTGNLIGVPITGGTRPGANTAGQTGADQWQIRYAYALSKRTEAGVGISRLKNKTNANYEMGGASTTVSNGSDAHAYAVFMSHRF
jgi:predicted porin